ncbi:class I SAM-dependent methyltransferase [Rariglobus hedericola]|uniref:Class I SAM-dependent methyltransferase n=1 Tax=Rariglobus hedericola TaxID=2597822 RepID=A0A556QKD5_9BACT|nr:class I SAM-dependent methyltransferase [Rariglobus hedericola]TSJ77110.1 class I SAM-dependent methyltransferase [Rariglobus hedericola]
MKTNGYDPLARFYRSLEFLAFGRALERARFQHFEQLRGRQRILLLGDGDGRGLALACQLAPHAQIDSVDFSAGMLRRAADRLSPADRQRVTLLQADVLTAEFPRNTYDAVTTLFFLDCFSPEQIRVCIDHVRPSLKPDAIWLYADFALPVVRGWARTRARIWLALMFTFFRWQTGLAIRELPPAEALLKTAGFHLLAETSRQGCFLRSAVYKNQFVT